MQTNLVPFTFLTDLAVAFTTSFPAIRSPRRELHE